MKKVLLYFLIMISCIVSFSACNKESESESKQKAIEFAYAELTLGVGESVQAEVITSKAGVYVYYSTNDESIATVSDDGIITAVAEGQTICFAEFGGETTRCIIKVTPKQAKPMLSLSAPYQNGKIVIYVGTSIDLQVDVRLGDDAVSDAQKVYEVANAQVVSVENGKLTALTVGETTITVRAISGEQNAEITLSVEVVEK